VRIETVMSDFSSESELERWVVEVVRVSKTLAVEVVTGRDPHVAVARDDGGLVQVEPGEVRGLVSALAEAAGLLAAAEAVRSVAQAVERRRVAGDQERDG
jgi:hypothetical protein